MDSLYASLSSSYSNILLFMWKSDCHNESLHIKLFKSSGTCVLVIIHRTLPQLQEVYCGRFRFVPSFIVKFMKSILHTVACNRTTNENVYEILATVVSQHFYCKTNFSKLCVLTYKIADQIRPGFWKTVHEETILVN